MLKNILNSISEFHQKIRGWKVSILYTIFKCLGCLQTMYYHVSPLPETLF